MADKKISQENYKSASQIDLAQDYVRGARGSASNFKTKFSDITVLASTKNKVVEIANFTGNDYTPTGSYSLIGKTPYDNFKIFSLSGGQLLTYDTSIGGYYDFDTVTGKITIPSGAERILIEINS